MYISGSLLIDYLRWGYAAANDTDWVFECWVVEFGFGKFFGVFLLGETNRKARAICGQATFTDIELPPVSELDLYDVFPGFFG